MSLSSTVDKRRRRTKAQVEQLEQQILVVLREDRPQSVRHIFYRMTDPRLPESVQKSENGYRHVQDRITKMRRAGLLPYSWITDSTRRGYHVMTYDGAGDFVRRVAGLYRANMWEDSEYYVEVWCESRSIAGVIEDDCQELAVSLYPAGGFASITLAYQAAEYINETTNYGDGEAHIIYIGDFDPAGVLIDRSVETELREHLDPDVDLEFHRLAINSDQIEQYQLPTKPRKTNDRRARYIHETVEAEAMPARILRGLLREKIESYLPPRALQIAKVAEESERTTLLDLANDLDDVA